MRSLAVIAAAIVVFQVSAGHADTLQRTRQPVVVRSAAGTVIQPTKTIIHNPNGSTTVIVVPRRSYLDTGTEVSVGDRGFQDYEFPPTGDPGRPNWFIGPDVQGKGRYPLPTFGDGTGYNPYTPF